MSNPNVPNTLLDAFWIYYTRLENAITEVSSLPTDPNVLGRRKAQVTEYADLVNLVSPHCCLVFLMQLKKGI